MAKILIKNGRVWDGYQFFFADILTDGNQIVKIDQGITEEATYVYDATGKIVSAGLVDCHVHMRLHPDDKYGIQAEMSCFPFGVTAAADAGRIRGNPELFDSFMLKNVMLATVRIHQNRPDLEDLKETLARFGHRAVGVKVYFDQTITDVTDENPLAEVCSFAKERNLRVMVHCSHSPVPMRRILSTLNPGDILTHAFHGGENNAMEDNFESMRAAQARGVIIDAGFAGYVHTDFGVFQNAIRAGIVPNTISTDITKSSAYIRGGRYGMTMCMSMARHMGMSEVDIFKAVTSNPARALGKEGSWGCLKVGGNADIAVLDDTNEGFSMTDKNGTLIESPMGYRCVFTVADGQIIYKH